MNLITSSLFMLFIIYLHELNLIVTVSRFSREGSCCSSHFSITVTSIYLRLLLDKQEIEVGVFGRWGSVMGLFDDSSFWC